MSLYFLLNNLHFSLEVFGALVFLVAAWLAFDAFSLRRDFLTASRGIGYLFLMAWQIIHALQLPSDLIGYVGYAAYALGIVFLLLNLVLEAPVTRPQFRIVLVLPAIAPLLLWFNVASAVGLSLIAVLSYRQYRREMKKTLRPFWIGFASLALGALFASAVKPDAFGGALWGAGHLGEFAGFLSIGWWIWRYLELRIREEIFLIFMSFTLLAAIIVSLSFSSILMYRIEAQTRLSLTTDARVLDLAIGRLREEALAKTRLFANDSDMRAALVRNDFPVLTQLSENYLDREHVGFLTLVDLDGNVILRAHALTRKDENLSQEKAVVMALSGNSLVTVGAAEAEGFSIRAAAPIVVDGVVKGVVLAGFPLDNAFVDSMKRVTDLDMSIFAQDTQVATTLFDPSGRQRSVGTKITDERVATEVLRGGRALTLRTVFLSRPFVASYLPLRDADNVVVGMLSAGRPQQAILETANATNRLTLATAMAVMFIFIMPMYAVTRRLSREIVS